jgi:hypothetical protein
MEKTEEQQKIDKECGCSCHYDETGIYRIEQNYMWCGNCGEKHQNDSRLTPPVQE